MPKKTFFNLDQEKRDRVLNSAIDEFAKNGYSKASITSIVNKAEIAKGSFYQYFKNKYDLFKYIIEIAVERKLEYINSSINNYKNEFDFIEYWKILNKAGIKFAKDNKDLATISLSLIKNKDKEKFNDIITQLKPLSDEMFEELIEKAQRKGQIRKDIDQKFISHLLYKSSFFISEYFLENANLNNFDDFLPMVDKMMEIISFGIKKEVD